MDLVEFLTARLDEDELWATEASRRTGEPAAVGGVHWQWEDHEADEVITPAPDRDEFVGGEDHFRVSLRSRETWPTILSRELPQFAIPTTEEVPSAVGGHIIRHDPARVLAEVAAKRRIVDASAASCSVACTTNRDHSFSGSCALRALGPVREVHGQRWVRDETGSYVPAPPVTPEWTLRLLALPYANHADYDEAWRP
ncbi:DUF6221 family protein [Streptomyces sp. NPDC059071]|uniref:DUF6221 family protein n=1 Tax=unclassified Streptomyces TaxID=2593676 RepID=UPI003657BFEA